MKYQRRISTGALLLLCIIPFNVSLTQTLAAATEDAKPMVSQDIQKLTTQQVEAKIKELGMTRAEAEAKAKEMGVDLNAFLQQRPGDEGANGVPDLRMKEAAKALPPDQAIPVDEEETVSEKKTEELQKTPEPELPEGLQYFGYSVFREVPSAFAPAASGPADPEYLIGPGDVLRISVWGQVEFQNELVVDREGRIFIPTVGQVLVSGLTLEKAYDALLKQMSRSYSGLVSQPPTVWLDVSLARLRPKRVFIMGEVTKPGGYTVSSYATVFSVLFSVGGPTINGSLRDVRVIRGNKVVAHVDLYNYLAGSEQTNDIRVQNNDIVFVPTRGKTVAITEQVRRPARYELLAGEHLRKLLEYAGGPLSTAYLERVQVDRIVPFEERQPGVEERRVVDVNFREILNANRDFELVDGDSITVYSIFEERLNIVSIKGAVVRPGQFQLEKVSTLKELIAAAEGLEPKAYIAMAHLLRLNPDRLTRTIMSFDLKKILDGVAPDLKLEPRDEVVVYSVEAIDVRERYVTIRGEVKNPGKYALRDNMTLQDLVLLAGGYTEEAEILTSEVARIVPGKLTGDTLVLLLHPILPREFNVPVQTRVFEGDNGSAARGEEFLLRHRDEVRVRPDPNYRRQQNVAIAGDITYPGTYSIKRKGERLSELLTRAGGPTATSYLGGAQFFRGGRRLLLSFVRAYFEKNEVHDVIMFDGDSIHIPSRPYTVFVGGEVNKPGLLSYLPGESVSDYIDRAGGLTDSASYAILVAPTGESRRVNFGLFRSNPEVAEGSTISVLKVPPPLPEGDKVDVSGTIKDTFAILTSAATIAFIVWQVSQ